MIRELLRSKRKGLVGAAVVCVVLIAGLAVLWPGGQVAEAAVLDPHPGLVGWWRFDEGDGGVAEDSGGYGNDGTIHGSATSVDGKHGKALSFDGTDNYISVPYDSSFDFRAEDDFSIEGWIKVPADISGGGGAYRFIVSRTDSLQFMIEKSDGKPRIVLAVDGSIDYVVANTDVRTNSWVHVVAVRNAGTDLGIYVNGELDCTPADDNNLDVSNNNDLYIGDYSLKLQTGRGFKDIMDEVRIYNRALSADEIQETFQRGPDFSSRLLAKVPKGTTQFIVTLSWQGVGSLNVAIESPSKNYTEDMVPEYQRTVYSSSSGDMLNVKRLVVSVTALSSDEDWYVVLEFDGVEDYRITVEVQR